MNSKLIYGNLLKVNNATYKSQFAFTKPEYRRVIKDIGIIEAEPVNVYYLSGSGTESEGLYGIINEWNEQSRFQYEWKIESGNAEIVSDPYAPTVVVRTQHGSTDETFVLNCMVIDDMMAYANISREYTHIKTSTNPITLTNVTEDSNSGCMYEHGEKCKAISTYTVHASSSIPIKYKWTVVSGSVIIESGQSSAAVMISSTNDVLSETFELRVDVTDELSTATETNTYTYTRTVRDAVSADSVVEDYNNACIAIPGSGGCVAASAYSFTYTDSGLPHNIVWSLWSATSNMKDVVIASGQGGDSIIVESDSDMEEINFNVRARISDGYTASYIDFPAQHTREMKEQLVIHSIVETVVGECMILSGDVECISQSTFVANTTQASGMTYVWSIIGTGTIISGQGTNEIIVETTGSDTTNSIVELTIDDTYSNVSASVNMIHFRGKEVTINSLEEIQSGSCFWETNHTCVATSIYVVDADDADTYKWIVSGNSLITNGQGGTTITVATSADVDRDFNVECICSNADDSQSIDGDYSHIRTEIPVGPIQITELRQGTVGSCGYLPGGQCTATSAYEAIHTGGGSYEWTVVGATLVSGQGTSIIVVETLSGVSIDFDVQCTITNSQYNDTRIESFTHTRTEVNDPVLITNIEEYQSGSCIYPVNDTCQTESRYRVTSTDSNTTTYVWEVVGAIWAYVDGKTDEIIVESDSHLTTNFNVKCTVNGMLGGTDSMNKNFTHTRSEQVYPAIVITSLTESVAGACEYPLGGSCNVESTYVIDATGYDTLVWEVSGDGVSIVNGQGTDTIVITTPDGVDTTNYNIKCTASNDKYTDYIDGDFSQVKGVNVIVITSLTETSPGSCEYPESGTCVATTEYTVVASDVATYAWTVGIGATIESGQGTNVITVSTDENVDKIFNVKCDVSNASGSDSINADYTHTRTEEILDVLDRHVTYDVNNIAQEFI